MNLREKQEPYLPDNHHIRGLTEGVKKVPLHYYPGIYAIVCTVNGKRYVGSSKNIQKRWWTHLSNLRNNKNHCLLLQNAWNKYGKESFVFEVLERVDNLDDLIPTEQKYLDLLKPEYNLRKIAEKNTGINWSPESIATSAAKNRGQKRSPEFSANLSKKMKGRTYSAETIEKMKESHANMSDATKSKMSVAKKGIAPTIAIQAAAKVNKGKPRPQAVIDKIKATRLKTAERKRAEGYKPLQGNDGKFVRKQS